MNEKKRYNEGYFTYADSVRTAKLDIKAKALLWFYAYTFNWTKGKTLLLHAGTGLCLRGFLSKHLSKG
jgi:hypothetical protein